MTKKGIVLSVILAILLITIAIILFRQSQKIMEEYKSQENEQDAITEEKTALELTYDTGFDLEELKSYRLPILIQISSPEDEDSARIHATMEELNKEIKGKAIIRTINIKEYPELLNGTGIEVNYTPTQVFISSEGTPIKDLGSELFGYKTIKNDERRRYI